MRHQTSGKFHVVRNSKPMKRTLIIYAVPALFSFCSEKIPEQSTPGLNQRKCSAGDTCFVITEDGLNLRKTPTLNGQILSVVPYGTELKVESVDEKVYNANRHKGKFVKVKFSKWEGWAFDGFLSKTKPTDAAAHFANKQTRAEIEAIRRLPPGEEKAAAVAKLRKRLSTNLNDVMQRFTDFEVCNIGLENKFCAGEEQSFFQGSQSEFFQATLAAIRASDRVFLQKYSSCLVNVSCYYCDYFETTHRNSAIDYLLQVQSKINLNYHTVEGETKNEDKPRIVYVFDKGKGRETVSAYFALGIVKAKNGWYIQKIGGQVMNNPKFETCGAGA